MSEIRPLCDERQVVRPTRMSRDTPQAPLPFLFVQTSPSFDDDEPEHELIHPRVLDAIPWPELTRKTIQALRGKETNFRPRVRKPAGHRVEESPKREQARRNADCVRVRRKSSFRRGG